MKTPLKCLESKDKYESKCLRSLLHHWLASNSLHNKLSIYLNKNFQLSMTFKYKVFGNIYISITMQSSTVKFHKMFSHDYHMKYLR